MGELRLVTNTDNTVTVEVDGLKEDSLVPGQQDIVTVKIVSVNPRWVFCVLISVNRIVRLLLIICQVCQGPHPVCG